jgi:alpha-galactosidase
MPGSRLRLVQRTDDRNVVGRKLIFAMTDDVTGLYVESHIQFYDGISVARFWTEVENRGSAPMGLEYVSSFAYTGLDKEGLGEDAAAYSA